MKIKTSKLTGPALDWAVAKCLKLTIATVTVAGVYTATHGWFYPSTDWAHGGPLIDQEGIDTIKRNGRWEADNTEISQVSCRAVGPTPLIAALRCYVTYCVGDEVEIPQELI